MLEGYLHIDLSLLPLTIDNLRVENGFLFIQILNIFFDASLIMEGQGLGVLLPQVIKNDLQSLGQESHLPKPVLQDREIKYGLFKDGIIRKKTYFGSSSLSGSYHFQGIHDFSPLISLIINLSIVENIYFKPG